MAYEASGIVHFIGPAETRGSFSFRKFVLETGDNPRYPQLVEFQTTRDNIGKLDSVNVGDELRVEFNLRGREWHSPSGDVKYFNTLDAWKLDVKTVAAPAKEPPRDDAPHAASIDDDIPF